jgi:hypothetical protein
MATPATLISVRTIHNIALAYFDVISNRSDAIRDLCTAGFQSDHINISRSSSSDKATDLLIPEAIGPHSRLWEWTRSYVHDLSRSGAEQMSGLNPTPSEGVNPSCPTLDLTVTLTSLGVSPKIIWLLTEDVLRGATYVLVDAHKRVAEASAIMSRNAGHVRTDYL